MKSILIVDDNSTILLLLSELIKISIRELSNIPVEIYTASSAEEAIAIACAQGIDLLITDFYLPGVTGLGLIRTVKSKSDNIVAVLMSSDHDLIATVFAHPHNAVDALLEKPMNRRDLKRLLRSFLSKQLGAKIL